MTRGSVVDYLIEQATDRPHALAVVEPQGRHRGRRAYTHLTYRQLHERSERLARGLERIGISHGCRTVVMVRPSLDLFTLTFALFKCAAVPVLIDPGMGMKNLGRCLGEAKPHAFIGTPKAHLARRLLGWARDSIAVTVTTGRRFGASFTLAEVLALGTDHRGPDGKPSTAPGETAALLFTSGSTGVAKGVVYTQEIFIAQVEMLRSLYGIEAGEVDLSTFPLFALFGPALGMTCIVPDMDPTQPAKADPQRLIEAIDDFGVTNLFGSPALLNRLGRAGSDTGERLRSLRRVISAGAPVAAGIIERLTRRLAPGVQVFTPYGATEALPVASIGSDDILGETRAQTEKGGGVCVGRPVPGIEVAIIPITDGPLASWSEVQPLGPNAIGEITVRGPIVTPGYFHRPEADALSKIPAADGSHWHRMGDVGYRDSIGRLWFCGRKSQRVVTPTGTLFTIPVESIFTTHPDVFRAALVGVPTPDGTKPVICVEREPESRRPERQLIQELRSLAQTHALTRSIDTFLLHPAFPVDIRHNAKIFREQLADWAARKRR